MAINGEEKIKINGVAARIPNGNEKSDPAKINPKIWKPLKIIVIVVTWNLQDHLHQSQALQPLFGKGLPNTPGQSPTRGLHCKGVKVRLL